MKMTNLDLLEQWKNSPRKKLFAALGIAGCLAAGALGSTLASNINLNNGAQVEFGQGVVLATACDNEILIEPNSTFVNGTPGEFKFSSVTLSNLDATDSVEGSRDGCQNKSFTLKMYKQNGDLIQRSYVISVGADSFSSADGTITSSNEGTTSSTVTLTFSTAEISASDVYVITIQSGDYVSALWAFADGGHLYQIRSMDNAANIDMGIVHDVADTDHPQRAIGYDDGNWGTSGLAFNPTDGKLYLLVGKCACGTVHSIYKFDPPASGTTNSIINAAKVGVIDFANNDGLDWTNYGFRGIAINSQGHIWIAVKFDGPDYAHLLRISPTDASIMRNIDLNSDTSDTDHGIFTITNKHAYGIAFDSNNTMWFAATNRSVDDSTSLVWTINLNDGTNTWRGAYQTSSRGNGNLTVDSNGAMWLSDWSDNLYSFSPGSGSPQQYNLQSQGQIPNAVYSLAWSR